MCCRWLDSSSLSWLRCASVWSLLKLAAGPQKETSTVNPCQWAPPCLSCTSLCRSWLCKWPSLSCLEHSFPVELLLYLFWTFILCWITVLHIFNVHFPLNSWSKHFESSFPVELMFYPFWTFIFLWIRVLFISNIHFLLNYISTHFERSFPIELLFYSFWTFISVEYGWVWEKCHPENVPEFRWILWIFAVFTELIYNLWIYLSSTVVTKFKTKCSCSFWPVTILHWSVMHWKKPGHMCWQADISWVILTEKASSGFYNFL